VRPFFPLASSSSLPFGAASYAPSPGPPPQRRDGECLSLSRSLPPVIPPLLPSLFAPYPPLRSFDTLYRRYLCLFPRFSLLVLSRSLTVVSAAAKKCLMKNSRFEFSFLCTGASWKILINAKQGKRSM
jgi:hypothetical protein